MAWIPRLGGYRQAPDPRKGGRYSISASAGGHRLCSGNGEHHSGAKADWEIDGVQAHRPGRPCKTPTAEPVHLLSL